MNNYDYKKLCPFKWFVLENFPFIEEDFETLNRSLDEMQRGNNVNATESTEISGAMVRISEFCDMLNTSFEGIGKLLQELENNNLNVAKIAN